MVHPKMSRVERLVILASVLSALGQSGHTYGADDDLVIPNGDFESGDLSSWTLFSGGAWEVRDMDQPNKQGR